MIACATPLMQWLVAFFLAGFGLLAVVLSVLLIRMAWTWNS